MEEPVRRKPDYNEQTFRVKDKKLDKEVARVAMNFVRDWRAGVLRDLPLSQASFEDCLIEYGVGQRIIDEEFHARVRARVNREATLIFYRQIASRESSLGVRLAGKFAEAVTDGLLPARPHYTRDQAEAFIHGAVGTGPGSERVLRDFAVAHNLKNEDLGLIEVEAGRVILLELEGGGS